MAGCGGEGHSGRKGWLDEVANWNGDVGDGVVGVLCYSDTLVALYVFVVVPIKLSLTHPPPRPTPILLKCRACSHL